MPLLSRSVSIGGASRRRLLSFLGAAASLSALTAETGQQACKGLRDDSPFLGWFAEHIGTWVAIPIDVFEDTLA